MSKQSKIESNARGEYILTFRRAPSLAPGNVLLTSEHEYLITQVTPAGEEIFLQVTYNDPVSNASCDKTIQLKAIDYVHIKLYL